MPRQRLTAEDYAAMAVAAAELATMSINPIRREYNKALSKRYRALSLCNLVAAGKHEIHQKTVGA